ncbi:MAG: phosphotransferase [Thalassobaculum sp.]|uniref:phosphotransferase family protein n=1 Tax=Thalassobaculum sp. TaxID=2022740 RepID=UPI0032EBF008
MTAEQVAHRVARVFADRHPAWHGALRPVGHGLEAVVFLTELEPYGAVAVKAPWRRFPGGSYGAGVDCRALLRQERVLAAWAAAAGLPVARPLALHETDDQDLLVSAYVEGDDRPPDPAGLGALLSRLHAAPPPELVPVVHGPSGDFRTALAARIPDRLDRVERLAGEALAADRSRLDAGRLRAALPVRPGRLLHMDFRAANLRCRGGAIRAVLDWSNAAIADPAFELARMHEAGTLTDAVLDGYGDRDWAARVPPAARILYHLDAALMFALVFRLGAPDPERAAGATERARVLLAELPAALERQASA